MEEKGKNAKKKQRLNGSRERKGEGREMTRNK